ncbi:MAG TPA: hypothetical protein VMB23_10380 [Spirochaetia bacterium]|jgi:hypothetical protein|nr:hypothetical protein [Spirochaetia bacterium]
MDIPRNIDLDKIETLVASGRFAGLIGMEHPIEVGERDHSVVKPGAKGPSMGLFSVTYLGGDLESLSVKWAPGIYTVFATADNMDFSFDLNASYELVVSSIFVENGEDDEDFDDEEDED